MMAAYGRAVIEDRLKPRQFAEIAAYVRREYGPGIGPGFLLEAAANGAAEKPRGLIAKDLLRAFARTVKSLVPG